MLDRNALSCRKFFGFSDQGLGELFAAVWEINVTNLLLIEVGIDAPIVAEEGGRTAKAQPTEAGQYEVDQAGKTRQKRLHGVLSQEGVVTNSSCETRAICLYWVAGGARPQGVGKLPGDPTLRQRLLEFLDGLVRHTRLAQVEGSEVF